METILNYLDNMFINLPHTPEVVRAKEDLAEMMEDKYNELIAEGKMQNEAIGIVISEFGNIQELIDELEITDEKSVKENSVQKFGEEEFTKEEYGKTDDHAKGEQKAYSTKDDFVKTDASGRGSMRHVTALEADEYLFAVKQAAGNIAAGVFLCICSPIVLMLLEGMKQHVKLIVITDGVAAGVGITVLLCMVACAVGLFISSGMKLEAYEYLKQECFILDPEYEQSVYHIWETHKRKFTYKIIIGVALCILSVIPVIVCSIIVTEMNKDEFPILVSIAFLLFLVAIGVYLFITGGMEEESYKVILQEKEFSIKRKSGKKIEDIIAAVYWPIIVIIYFVWSFVSGSWGITWIIWPFAGIIYDIICKIIDSAAPEK